MLRGLVRLIVIFVRWVWPLIVKAVTFALKAMGVAFLGLFNGWPNTARSMANQLVGEAVMINAPTETHSAVYKVGLVIAYFVLVFGWIILSYVTVWVIGFLLR